MDGSTTTAAVAPDRYAALFVDMPNLEHKNTATERRLLLNNEVNWPYLFEQMLQSLESDHFLYVGTAYDFVRDGEPKTRVMVQQMLRQLLGSEQRVSLAVGLKDIDASIVNDIWYHTLSMVQQQRQRGKKPPYEVTILLGGGDGVYAEPIRGLKNLFGKELQLSLHTFSWERSLARDLTHISNKIYFLDQLPQFQRTELKRA